MQYLDALVWQIMSSCIVLKQVSHPHLHLVLQLLAQHTVELMRIVLQERVVRCPAEGGCQVLGGHRDLAVLKLQEARGLKQ